MSHRQTSIFDGKPIQQEGEQSKKKPKLRPPCSYTSQFYFCPNFLSMDVYKGCAHGCLYCFARTSALSNASCITHKGWFEAIEKNDVGSLRKTITGAFRPNRDEANMHLGVKLNMPIHVGGLSDPLQPIEEKWEWAKTMFQILNNNEMSYIVSTKNKRVADPTYLQLWKDAKKCLIQLSLIGTGEKVKRLEAHASTPEERLQAIETVHKEGLPVVVRLQPFVYKLFEAGGLEDFITTLKSYGTHVVTVEFLKLCNFRTKAISELYREMSDILGYNLLTFYKLSRDRALQGSDVELKPSLKIPIMLRIRDLLHKHGLAFYSADNALRILGDGACCCGYPEGWFESKYTQFQNRLPFIARDKGEVKFRDIYPEPIPEMLLFKNVGAFLNTQGKKQYRARKDWSFLTYIKRSWNDLKQPNNPSVFFANIKPTGEKDEDGMLIYRHDNEWIDSVLQTRHIDTFKT